MAPPGQVDHPSTRLRPLGRFCRRFDLFGILPAPYETKGFCWGAQQSSPSQSIRTILHTSPPTLHVIYRFSSVWISDSGAAATAGACLGGASLALLAPFLPWPPPPGSAPGRINMTGRSIEDEHGRRWVCLGGFNLLTCKVLVSWSTTTSFSRLFP